jgi:class 3 adenylate cyclase/ketosteroid isomerase-like protein/tetratricopeptide (TPR) repeat protein
MPSLICAACGHTNGADARFCEQCGSSLAPRCPSCGAEVSPTARFCSSCGSSIAEATPASVALKVVSVVFSDLVGSTELQEKLEPESVRRVMARFYEAMRDVVERHGGAIQKFIGDAVVAVFGVPSVSEDDALRAVRCAAAMTAALHALNDEIEPTWGVRLQIRTGVNTGELAISDEGIFVGDTMNTAARLEQAADADQVLLGEATWRLVRHQVEVQEVAALELKGKSEAVRVWKLVSAAPRSTAGTEAPLVGRARELERLRSGLEQAIGTRACRLVTVIGSPGLGKSRLASEFARSLEGQAMVLEGHCESSGEGITFLPVAEVLRAAASIADDDPPEQVVSKLTETVPEGPDRERIVARVAGLLGAAPPAAPEETFWGVRSVLESLAGERPLVVVLDDVHWGQPMFLDLIEHLVEWVRDAAILLVALARPELRETRAALANAGRRAVDVIALDPLGPDQSRELVGGLLGEVDVPDELLDRILETTEGNPLFLGELLRMLVDEGSLERDGEVWVAAGGAEAVQVPPTIQALLTARIERLRADERSVVERAAVIGKQFYRGAVAELVAPPIRSGIDGHLETLRRKDMVEPEGTYWIDEPVYRFHHVLIRDAAYHLLLKEARAELHEKFADWLETKVGELVGEHEEVIAYHLEQAHEYRRQLGPLDQRGRALGASAAERLASAGRRALAREDLAAAANLLQRALDREAGVSEEEILWHLGEALLSAGDTASAAPVVRRLSGARGDVLGAQLAVLTGAGSLEQTLQRVSAATAELAGAGDDAAEAKGHHVTAQVQAQLGRVADVESSLDRALLAARKADDRRRITAVLAAAPRAALWGPSPVVRASGRCLDVVRILRMTPGNRHVEAVALRCQAVLEAMRGRTDAAREILAGGRATLEELGLTLELHELAMHAGIVELLADQPRRAEELLRTARDGFAGLGLSVSAAQAAALLARALAEQGRDEQALAETEYAQEHAGGDLKTTITWLGVRAEALARGGQTGEALELARRAVALADPTDALADKADANMALAHILRETGRPDEARSAADAARVLYAQKDHAVGVHRADELASGAAPAAPSRVNASAVRIDDPELAAVFACYKHCWEAHDVEGLAALYADDYVTIDHRELGWAVRTGLEANLEWFTSSMALADDLEVRLDEVMGCAPGVLAFRATWWGHSVETGGEGELVMSDVMAVRDGKITRIEIFEPGAESSIRACFEDLRGRMLLGDRPPELCFRRYADAFARRDREALAGVWSADSEFVDHRLVSGEELHGRETMLEAVESAFRIAPDIRWVVDEVLACDERVIAMRVRYVGSAADGGGDVEVAVGTVNVVDNDMIVSADRFDHDDREGMLARYRELGGTLDVLGDRPPERWWAEFKRLVDAHDLDALLELYHDDWTLTDHRQVGSGVLREPSALFQTLFDGSPDLRVEVDEVIACDERVIALAGVYSGSARDAGGGTFELPFAVVSVIEDGRAGSTESFDPDDRIAIIARWRELHGLGLLGDRPPEQEMRLFIELWGQRDREGLKAHWREDVVLADQRSLAWEEVRGGAAMLELSESAWKVSPDVRLCVDEVIACDERVLAIRCTYVGSGAEGGGMMELPIGFVNVVEDGRLIRTEVFDPEHREKMLARYRELGGQMPAELGERPSQRVLEDLRQAQNERDYGRLAELVTDDWYMVDHRALGWPEAHGRKRCLADLRSVYGASPTVRLEYEEVPAADDHVVVTLQAWRGQGLKAAEHETRAGAVHLIRDGRWAGVEFYEPDDREAMLARFAELAGDRKLVLGDRPPERVWARYISSFNASDFGAFEEILAPDYAFEDHRTLGYEPTRGIERGVGMLRSARKASADLRIEAEEVLACDERVIALRVAWRGHGVKAGQLELPMGVVAVVEQGRLKQHELFNTDDRAAIMARYVELGGKTSVLGDRPSERMAIEIQRALNGRAYERLAGLVADDWYWVDHRALGWDEAHGRDQCLAIMRSAYDASPDVHLDYGEVLASDDNVIAVRIAWRGHGLKAGELEVEVGAVYSFKDGVWAGIDFYEPDDRRAMIVRYAELGGGLARLGDTGSERWFAEYARRYAAHDLDGMVALIADGWLQTDHRELGWGDMDKDVLAVNLQTSWDNAADIRLEVDDVIAADDRVFSGVCAYRGRADAAGGSGQFEFPLGVLTVTEGDHCIRTECFDSDDREAMLARYRELTESRHAAERRYVQERLGRNI